MAGVGMADKITSMGNALGNIAALLVISVAGIIAGFSFRSGSIALAVAAYGLFFFVWLGDMLTKPSRGSQVGLLLSGSEITAYRKYHTYLMFPAAGQALSAFLNLLRLAGMVWGLASLWNSDYWVGAVLIGYFFVVGFACLRFDPVRYMIGAAKKGNDVAREQLALIERVRERCALFRGNAS